MSYKIFNYLLSVSLALTSLSTIAQSSISAKIRKSNLYAGIEVGSKGVKMTIIQVGKNASITGNFVSLKDTAINTDFISFTNTSFSNTLKALYDLYTLAAVDYTIPSQKIYTVISSGVKGQAIKDNKTGMLLSLADSFKVLVKEPQRKFTPIDAMEEAKLSHIGIVPEPRRFSTFLIDIGSGNTKGGYFKNGNTKELKLFTLTWGTKSITNATDKRLEEDKSILNYKKQLSRVIAGEPEAEIVFAVNESGAYNMNDYFAFSGGIAWASATLMYPELVENSVVPVSFNDLVVFSEKLSSNFVALSPDLLVQKITDETIDKQLVFAEAKKVHKVFDQKSLMAGTALLIKIMRQFEGTQEKKQFYLVKNGQVGWISAYVNQAIN